MTLIHIVKQALCSDTFRKTPHVSVKDLEYHRSIPDNLILILAVEPRVVNIPVDTSAMIQSSRFRPYLKRRFVLPGIGMPTYVREGDIPIRYWN